MKGLSREGILQGGPVDRHGGGGGGGDFLGERVGKQHLID